VYYYTPPYVLFIAGLLASIAAGLAFEATLKQGVKEWSNNRSTYKLVSLQGFNLFVPFLGIAAGICVFLGSGMEIFGFNAKMSYAIAIPLTLLTCWLVWYQLGKILVQLEQGGSKSLDLDSLN
jgi:hypothetical protein